jgi:hypothetical protein
MPTDEPIKITKCNILFALLDHALGMQHMILENPLEDQYTNIRENLDILLVNVKTKLHINHCRDFHDGTAY